MGVNNTKKLKTKLKPVFGTVRTELMLYQTNVHILHILKNKLLKGF